MLRVIPRRPTLDELKLLLFLDCGSHGLIDNVKSKGDKTVGECKGNIRKTLSQVLLVSMAQLQTYFW